MVSPSGREPRGPQRPRRGRRWLTVVGLWSVFSALWLYVQVAQPPFMSCVGPSMPTRPACTSSALTSIPPPAIIAIYLVGLAIFLAAHWLTRPR